MDKKYYPEGKGPKQKDVGLGLIHVVYGQGAGKTSRAMGLALRAVGNGLPVCLVQFMKSPGSGEVKVLAEMESVDYFCAGEHPFVKENGIQNAHKQHAKATLDYILQALENGAKVVIADEILNALLFRELALDDVLDLINACRGRAELMLTGADAPRAVIDQADYATELKMIKHPYNEGILARKGIEY